jgi:N6-adenosine-specific RNA methylase IME4
VRVDEAKDIHDCSIALAAYAFQAKDAQLAADAAELRKRAERRIGELIRLQKESVGLARAGRKKIGFSENPISAPSLAAAGIDKNLAHRSRKAAAVDEDKFQAQIAEDRRLAAIRMEDRKGFIAASRQALHEERLKRRARREEELASKLTALPDKKYAVIVADPEWKFKTYSEKGLSGTSADNHYVTSELEDIKARDVASIAADDCVLFLWATIPMLPQALAVMEAWGFKYVSSCTWVKDRAGTGYWFRSKHEVLLVGTRGNIPAPSQGTLWESVICANVRRHSEKPDEAYEMIAQYYPNVPKIELNARDLRPGFDVWGTLEFVRAAE